MGCVPVLSMGCKEKEQFAGYSTSAFARPTPLEEKSSLTSVSDTGLMVIQPERLLQPVSLPVKNSTSGFTFGVDILQVA